MASEATPPSVSWAQRSARVFVTFNIECPKPDIKIEKQSVRFTGICAPDQKLYEVNIPLYAEIDVEKSSSINKGRYIELILSKVITDAPFWPSLTSDKKKPHWLKVDFEKWQDEDGSDEEFDDMNDMFSSKIGDFGDGKEESSSDEEHELPDLE